MAGVLLATWRAASNQSESQATSPLWSSAAAAVGTKRPHLALIGLPATKDFCGARADDGLVRSVSSNFDFWACWTNRMPMSWSVSIVDQTNKQR